MKTFFLTLLGFVMLLILPAVALADPVGGGPPVINSNGGGQYIVGCNNSATIALSASGDSQIIAAPGAGLAIHICHVDFISNSSGINVQMEYGTGSNCGTGKNTIGLPGAYSMNQVGSGINIGTGLGELFQLPAATAYCLNLSGADNLNGLVSYTIIAAGL